MQQSELIQRPVIQKVSADRGRTCMNLQREVLMKRHNILRKYKLNWDFRDNEGVRKVRLGHDKIPCIVQNKHKVKVQWQSGISTT